MRPGRRLCAGALLLAVVAAVGGPAPPASAQGGNADLTGAWKGNAGDKIAIWEEPSLIRLCTARSTEGGFIKVYTGAPPADSSTTTLTSVPRTIKDIGAGLPPAVRAQLIARGYAFRVDLRRLISDRIQVAWYVDDVTYSRTTLTVSSVTPATIPTAETFSRAPYGTPGWVRRAIDGILIHFGRVLRNDSRWRDWYKRIAAERGAGDLGPNIRKLAKFRTREELSGLGKGLSQLADRSRIGQLAKKTRGQLVESAGRTSSSWNQAAGVSEVAGNLLLSLGLAISAFNIITAPDDERGRVAFGEAGTWLGGLAFGHVGMELGAGLGTLIMPGPGTVVGAILGGLLGGGLGGDLGAQLTQMLHDALFGRTVSTAALFERCSAP